MKVKVTVAKQEAFAIMPDISYDDAAELLDEAKGA